MGNAMQALVRIAARVVAFVRRSHHDQDVDEELQSHLSMLVDDNIRRGMTPAQARRAALIRLGGVASLRDQHRAARGLPFAETLLHDLRFAFRLISRDRWFSAAAIGAIALGIGANTLGFTIVHGAFFRGLPFEDSDRLSVVSWQHRSGRRVRTSHAELQHWRDRSRIFAGLAGYSNSTMNISDERALPEQVQGTRVTANLFGVLRQKPLLGRDFGAHDENLGADPVVIIGGSLWKHRFAADPNVLGRILRVNGQPTTIVGVMPEGMRFPDDSDLWMPFVPAAPDARAARVLTVFGRLADGADRRQAHTESSVIGRQLVAAYPDATKDLVSVRVETFPERFIGGAGRPMIITVMAAVVFVLLIACANVANMLLSRSAYRAREIAARMALGATRWRIVRQLLVESVVLGILGGSVGLVLAVAGVKMFDAGVRRSLPYWVVFPFEYVVFGYVAGICLLTAVLFGLAPALHVSRTSSPTVLKEGGRSVAGTRRQRRFSGAMVVGELALTIVLLVGAGSMIRSFMVLYAMDIGIPIDHLMAMNVQLPAAKYGTPDARRAFFERLEPELTAIPGVEAAAVTTGVPPLDGGERLLEIDRARPSDAPPVHVGTVTVTPRFFQVVGVSMVRGRTFHDRDGTPGLEAVIINERLAAQFFPGEDPIGRRLRFTERQPTPGKPADVWRTIVGISPLIKQGSSLDSYVNAVVYIPFRQEAPSNASLLIRSTLPPESVMDAVRREVQRIDPDQPVFTIRTLAQVMAEDRSWQRLWSAVFGTLALVALLLSSVGLYAIMAYAVAQRTQEIGVRMALGARKNQMSWLILRRGLVQLTMGLTLGFAASLAVRRLLPGGLVGITSHDPVAIAGIAVILTVVSLAACLIPARRASRVDPLVALRTE